MGVGRVEADSAETMSELLKKWYVARKMRFSRDPESAQAAAQRDIESSTFLATNPMQAIVLLQQLIVDDLLVQHQTQSATAEISQRLSERNRSSRHIAQQMLNNEVAILELLTIPPE